jgi:hypothetical protein
LFVRFNVAQSAFLVGASSECFTVLLAELAHLIEPLREQPRFKKTGQACWDKLKQAWFEFKRGGSPTVVAGIRAAANAATAGWAGDVVDIVAGRVTDQAGDTLAEYAKIKRCQNEFRDCLADFAKLIERHYQGPIVFCLDDLPRAHPHFIATMLATIEHLFWVANVQFVMVCKPEQLIAPLRSVYGDDCDLMSLIGHLVDPIHSHLGLEQ